MLISLLSFLFVFMVVVLVHEFGHFFAARRAGIRVYEFAIGFGPKVFSIKKGDTSYSLNAIPVGGFVRLAGIEGKDGEDEACPEDQKYYNKTPGQKFISIALGPIMNILLAFVLLSGIFLFSGIPAGLSNKIASVAPNSEAERIGLRPGDIIAAVDGKEVTDMAGTIRVIHSSAEKELQLKIIRNGNELLLKATPALDPELNIGLIGFSPAPLIEKAGPIKAVIAGAKETVGIAGIMLVFLALLFSGRVPLSHVAGPVGIAQFAGQAAHSGPVPFIYFMAFLSVNLGILNLLPIPALDGGRLVFVAIEWLRKKPLSIEKENRIHLVGLAILLVLILVVTINDVMRIFGGR